MSNATRDFENRLKQNEIPESRPTNLGCKDCYETGFAWLECDLGDGLKNSAWVYCSCSNGKRALDTDRFKLPRLDHEMKALFKVKNFPVRAFVPSAFTKNYEKALWSKVNDFDKDLRASEQFWDMK